VPVRWLMKMVSPVLRTQSVNADCTEAGPPDPRKGLNPKVIEVYTKSVFLSLLWAYSKLTGQSRIPFISIQIRSIAQSTQDSTLPTALGPARRSYRTYQMDSSCFLCLHQDLCLQSQAGRSSSLSRGSATRQGQGGYADECWEIECASI
jgi:hypothetical protein